MTEVPRGFPSRPPASPRPPKVRVRLYPQSPLGAMTQLETVPLSQRVGTVTAGPADPRIYTIAAPGKRPYDGQGPDDMLRWRGPVLPDVAPGPDGHFDHLLPSDPGFRQVHLYGCVRFALDVWEGYLGRPITWHFARRYRRLELIALDDWPNAQMGYGYLEVGARRLPDGTVADLALDFDVIAHEVGHALLMSFGGVFDPRDVSADYEAFHEASADWASMVAALHFDSVLNELMEGAGGDLDSSNRLNRFSEFSPIQQVRMANNPHTMWDFQRGWTSEHDLAQPFTAAMFDAFVEIYNEMLVAAGAIPRSLERLAERAERDPALQTHLRRGFTRAFERQPEPFYHALVETREIAAMVLIGLWRRIDPTDFSFDDLAGMLQDIDREEFNGRLAPVVGRCLRLRGVGVIPPGPRLARPGRASHMHSLRTAMPE